MTCKECNKKYVGQTERSKLDLCYLKYWRINKSSAAQHALKKSCNRYRQRTINFKKCLQDGATK